jgi:hypothetical protein
MALTKVTSGIRTLATDEVVSATITDSNVTTAKIADNAVTLAKMAGIADGKMIAGDANGDPTYIGAGNSGEILISAGNAAPPAFGALTLSAAQISGLAKGWVKFTGTGTIAITASFNVSGIVDDGTGLYTVTWDTNFSSANYVVVGTCELSTKTYVSIISQAVGSVSFRTSDFNGSVIDSDDVHIVAYGDQ